MLFLSLLNLPLWTLVSLNCLRLVPSGGSGPYMGYQWYVDGTAQSGQTASTFNYSPASAGTYSITVMVTNSSGFPLMSVSSCNGHSFGQLRLLTPTPTHNHPIIQLQSRNNCACDDR